MATGTRLRSAALHARTFLLGEIPGEEEGHSEPWWKVIWLSGVDYFSTLGYQPSIAFLAAGALAPIATMFLVAMTLFAALPVYREVAQHSHAGMGSIAMLEKLVSGWRGKLAVLVLLGFAATDFVITITLSASDAAKHAIENPLLRPFLGDSQLLVALALLGALAWVFLNGFREAIGIAMRVAIPYLVLNAVVLGFGIQEIYWSRTAVNDWSLALAARGNWAFLAISAGLVFPKLALGLSGFETGVSVMPQIRGVHLAKIRGAHHLLLASAVVMSVLLVASSFVTTLLVPPALLQHGGEANGRALSWLAHHLLGSGFGSFYDLVTIAILWFAGSSALAGLLNIVPRFLPRLGMAPRWVEKPRTLVAFFFSTAVVVTLVFRADVDAQGGAYATGVLAVMLSAAVAVTLTHFRKSPRKSAYFALVSVTFGYVFLQNIFARPDGLLISAVFIAAILAFSFASRWRRSTELRVEALELEGPDSGRLLQEISGQRVHLVPLEHPEEREEKAREIASHFRAEGPLAFVHVEQRDDRSEFSMRLRVHVEALPDGNWLIRASNAVAVANAIAFLSEKIEPRSIFLTLTRQDPLSQTLSYVLFGSGEIGISIYEVLARHWEAVPRERRPEIFLLSHAGPAVAPTGFPERPARAIAGASRLRPGAVLVPHAHDFADALSRELFRAAVEGRSNVVPIEHDEPGGILAKIAEVRSHYRVEGMLVFVHVEPDPHLDRRSSGNALRISIEALESGDVVIRATGARSVPDAVSFLCADLRPDTVFLGLSRIDPMREALRYLLGRQEIALRVYATLQRRSADGHGACPRLYLLSD